MSRWAPSLRPSPLFETLIGGASSEPKSRRVPNPEPAAELIPEPTPESAATCSDVPEADSIPATAICVGLGPGSDSEVSEWEFCGRSSATLSASPSLPDHCKHKPSAPVKQLPPREDTPGGDAALVSLRRPPHELGASPEDQQDAVIENSFGLESSQSREGEVEDDREISKRKWPPQKIPILQEVPESKEIQEQTLQRDDEGQERQHGSELMQQRSHARAGAGRAKARGKGAIGGVLRGARDAPGDFEKHGSPESARGGRHGGRRRARGRGRVVVAALGCDGGEGKGHWEPEVASTAPPASETADLASELAEFASEAADLGSVDGATPSHASSTSRSQHARWADYSDEEEFAPEEELAAVRVVTAEDLTTQAAEQTSPPSGRKGRTRRRRRGGGMAGQPQSQ